MERKLKVLDLFSGIGGFALGLDSIGFFETVKFVEMDKYCQKVLRKNFPNIPIEEDIKNVKGKEYEADVVVGGFPCQPFSVAGKQKGTDDNRYLWPEMLRLIREIKPEFVIGENVQGLINLQNGVVLRQVQDQLESEGFEVQCFLIPASGIGAWHQRYRVWIVGHSQHNGLLAAEKRCRDEKDYGGSQKRENETIEPTRASGSRNDEDVSNTEIIGTRESRNIDQEKRNEGCSPTQSNSSSEDVSNTNESLRGGGRTIPLGGENKVWRFRVEEEGIRDNVRIETVGRDAVSGEGETDVSQSNNERRKESDISQKSEKQIFNNRGHDEKEHGSNSEGERSQGHGLSTNMEGQSGTESTENSVEKQYTWWQTESNLCGVPNGISYELDKNRANRIKTLGNAIVPQIAREFGLAIKKVLSDEDII
jgi:DNA-cytosine methyltransferase